MPQMSFALKAHEHITFVDEASRAKAALTRVFPTPVFAPQTMKVGTDRLTCSDLASDRPELNVLTVSLRPPKVFKSECNILL